MAQAAQNQIQGCGKIELVEDTGLSDIACPSCGSSFSLIDETISIQKAKPRTIGHFELHEQVGVGAFGSVWKSKDTSLDRIVAVKIPRKGQLDSEETEQFLRAMSHAELSIKLNPYIPGAKTQLAKALLAQGKVESTERLLNDEFRLGELNGYVTDVEFASYLQAEDALVDYLIQNHLASRILARRRVGLEKTEGRVISSGYGKAVDGRHRAFCQVRVVDAILEQVSGGVLPMDCPELLEALQLATEAHETLSDVVDPRNDELSRARVVFAELSDTLEHLVQIYESKGELVKLAKWQAALDNWRAAISIGESKQATSSDSDAAPRQPDFDSSTQSGEGR